MNHDQKEQPALSKKEQLALKKKLIKVFLWQNVGMPFIFFIIFLILTFILAYNDIEFKPIIIGVALSMIGTVVGLIRFIKFFADLFPEEKKNIAK